MHPKLTLPYCHCNKREGGKKGKDRGNEITSLHFWKQSCCMSQTAGQCCLLKYHSEIYWKHKLAQKVMKREKWNKHSKYYRMYSLTLWRWSHLWKGTGRTIVKYNYYTLKIKDWQQFQDRQNNHAIRRESFNILGYLLPDLQDVEPYIVFQLGTPIYIHLLLYTSYN